MSLLLKGKAVFLVSNVSIGHLTCKAEQKHGHSLVPLCGFLCYFDEVYINSHLWWLPGVSH